jgi:hypothetical protein
VIVEVGGRVEVISGGGEQMALPPTVEHPGGGAGGAAAAGGGAGAGGVVSETDDDTHTPFSAELSLDTPKSYMSATGAEEDLNGVQGAGFQPVCACIPNVSRSSSQARASSSRTLTRHSRTPQLPHTT